jgi:hypothetical protein
MTTTESQYRSASMSYAEADTGYGWVLFAGIMLSILAMMNCIYGIAAVSNSTFFVGDAKYVVSDLNTWGWVLIGISVVQLITAFCIWGQVTGFRWVGVAIAALNAVVQLIAIQAAPFWALCLFALDILVIYGLVAHGARRTA